MIFVTLGTQDKKFPRLLETVENLNTDEEIIMQTGSTDFSTNKENIKIYKYLTPEEFSNYMEESSQVITHAGVGTLVQGLKLHKKMIVAARLKKYKEHVNDHQLQILKTFEEEGYIVPLYNFDDLEKLLKKEFTPKDFKSNNKDFVKLFDNEIKKLTENEKEKNES